MPVKASDSSPANTSWQAKWIARENEPLLTYFAAFALVMLISNSILVFRLAMHQRRSRQALKLRPSERETIVAALDAKVICIVKKLHYVSAAYFVHAILILTIDCVLMFSDMVSPIAEGWNLLSIDLYSIEGLSISLVSLAIGLAAAWQFNRLIEKIIVLQVAALEFAMKRSASPGQLTSDQFGSSGSRISEASIITQHLSMILSALSFGASAWLPFAFYQPSGFWCLAYAVIYNIVFRSAATWLVITYDVVYGCCSEPLTAEIHRMFAIKISDGADATLTLPANDTKREITDIV